MSTMDKVVPEKLFIMEKLVGGKWTPTHFWLMPFRRILNSFAKDELARRCYRVRRVKTISEAEKLEDLDNTRLQLPMNHHKVVEWVEGTFDG